MSETSAAGGIVTAALLVIGDEILSGRTKDRNIGHIADHLTGIGIQLKHVRIVPDEEAEIVDAVNALRSPKPSASLLMWMSGRSRPCAPTFSAAAWSSRPRACAWRAFPSAPNWWKTPCQLHRGSCWAT